MKRETFLEKDIGYTYSTEELTVTKEDFELIDKFLGETEDIFINDEFAKSLDLGFESKIIPGMFLILMAGKLDATKMLAFDAVMVSMDNLKFLAPAHLGDRLRLEGELINKRFTSKGHTLVTWDWTLKNQNDTTVMTGSNTEIFAKEITLKDEN